MRFGSTLPWVGPNATQENVSAVATAADRLGYDFAYMGGHYLYPAVQGSYYPYTVDGVLQVDPTYPNLDMFTMFAFIAGQTKTLGLKSHVYVLPWQSPLVSAKQLATLDVLSQGRVAFGIGVGWMKEEFDILGIPFEERGARTDEYIDVMRAVWAGGPASFEGRFLSFKDIYAEPTPVQTPLPIWATGSNQRTIRRVAERCDGWLVPGDVETASDAHAALREQLFQRLEACGRGGEAESFPTSAMLHVHFYDAGGGYKRSQYTMERLMADREAVLERLAVWAAAGITEVEVRVGSSYEISAAELIERISWFAEEVIPAARSL
jgi:probable F420-dependent oxidoreductase